MKSNDEMFYCSKVLGLARINRGGACSLLSFVFVGLAPIRACP